MSRKPHPKKDVEKALKDAENQGWDVEDETGHWGRMFCPNYKLDDKCRGGLFCRFSISGTPKNTGNHVKQIRSVFERCPFKREKE